MTKEAIIAEIKKLSPEERHEIAEMLWEDDEYAHTLSDEEFDMVQDRLRRYHDHPETGISMEEMARRHGL